MKPANSVMTASLLVFATGVFWGLYWLPVRQFEIMGLAGPWGTVAITVAAVLVLFPFAARQWRQASDPVALFAIFAGGIAFTFYSVGFIYGRVALVTLMFYLTPVWSTLITRYVLGWPTAYTRIAAIVVGFIGLLLMLSATGGWPLPRNLGEWLGLASGILWAVSSTAQRVRPALPSAFAAFVFAAGGAVSAIVLAVMLSPFPTETLRESGLILAGLAVLSGGFWWGLCLIALMWAVPQLDPARVGMLLLAEVLVGAGTAAWLAGEHIARLEFIGGALVLCAAVLEVWPTKSGAVQTNPPTKEV